MRKEIEIDRPDADYDSNKDLLDDLDKIIEQENNE